MSDSKLLLLPADVITREQVREISQGLPLRLGIVGCGAISSLRLHPSLHGLPYHLVAVCDLDKERAEEYARVLGAETAYSDYAEMFAEAELDAVIVCVGPLQHPKIAIDAMEAGIPVLTEKPPAASAAEAVRMAEASDRTGTLCMTAFNNRFAPAYMRAREIVTSNAFGEPSMLSASWHCPRWYSEDPSEPRTWYRLDFAIHFIDLARYLYGEVADVYAAKQDDATYGVTLRFQNGAVGVLAFSGNRQAQMKEQVELIGSRGQVVAIDEKRILSYYHGENGAKATGSSFYDVGIAEHRETAFTDVDSFGECGYRGELAELAAAVKSGHQPRSSIASALKTMRLYEAIVLSAEERRVVPLGN
jgi:predicted dehydrogenase